MKQCCLIYALCFFIISCDKEVSVSPHLEHDYKHYKLFVNSNPQGAEILVNGRSYGKKTPDTITYLSPGLTDIKLRLKYWRNYIDTFEGKENVTKSLDIDFFKIPNIKGTIKFRAGSDSIFINGNFVGFTPREDLLFPGLYSVVLSKARHITEKFNIEIYSNQTINTEIYLTDTTYFVPLRKLDERNDSVLKLFFDKSKNLIYVSCIRGILKLSNQGKLIKLYGVPDPSREYIYYVYEEIDKTVLLTQRDILIYKNEEFISWNDLNRSIKREILFSIVKDTQGIYWIGTDTGLWKYNNGQITNYNRTNIDIISNTIKNLVCVNNKTYFSSENNLYSIQNNNTINLEETFAESYVENEKKIIVGRDIKKLYSYNNCLTVLLEDLRDKSGASILGPEILYVTKNNKLERKEIVQMRTSKINAVKIDERGNYWVLTSEGIKIYDSNWNSINILPTHILNKLTEYYLLDLLFVGSKTIYLVTSSHGLIKVKL